MSCNGMDERVLVNYEAEIERILQEEDERKRAIRQAYLQRNAERIKNYHRNYYKENRGEKIKAALAHYNKNKDTKNQKEVCLECNKLYTRQNKKRHEQSKYHKEKVSVPDSK